MHLSGQPSARVGYDCAIASPLPHRRGAFALAAAAPIAVVVIGIIEALRIPAAELGPAAVAVATGEVARVLLPLVPAVTIALGATLAASRWPAAARVLPAVLLLAGGAGAVASYQALVAYPRFAGYPPFIAAWSALAVGLGLLYVAAATGGGRRLGVLGAVAALAVLPASLAAAARFADYYPSLHVSLALVRGLCAHAAVAVLLRIVDRPRAWSAMAAAAALLVAAGSITAAAAGDEARRAARRHTVAGPAALLAGLAGERPCTAVPAPLEPDEAERVFADRSGFPALDGIDLAGRDVIFVLLDTVRFDVTAAAGAPYTPHLARLSTRPGAYVFTRAYAPSSRTWLSVAGIFAMAPPSLVPVVATVPEWTGRLPEGIDTVPEVYARSGYHTVGVRHDFPGLTGDEQGFAVHHQEPRRVTPRRTADDNMVARLIDELEAAPPDRPVFAWLFLYSAHAAEEPRPDETSAYLDDVRFVDRKLGELMDYLEASGRAERAVVVVSSDHGEALLPGGRMHGLALDEDLIHVPLVVRIPGAEGGQIDEVVDLTGLFPWLLGRGDATARAAAAKAIRAHQAPVLGATGGAAVAELVDGLQNRAALVWPDERAEIDPATDTIEVTPLGATPADPAARDRVERYLSLRACLRRARVSDEVVPAERTPVAPAVPYHSR